MSTNSVIRLENPREDGVRELIGALDSYLGALYPPASNHFLDLEQLSRPEVRFFVARRDGAPLACGALRIDAGYGEVKRMYVSPRARGQGLGRAILETLEAEAARAGLKLVRLETGIHQAEAIALYRSSGYVDCPPFGEYKTDPLSRFMEKRLRVT
jgi:putative acetyltransferase